MSNPDLKEPLTEAESVGAAEQGKVPKKKKAEPSTQGQSVDVLNKYLLFDHMLKEKSSILHTKEAMKSYRFQQKYLYKI